MSCPSRQRKHSTNKVLQTLTDTIMQSIRPGMMISDEGERFGYDNNVLCLITLMYEF